MRTNVPETESSESDASDEPGPKEDPPHLRARPASDLEGDPEAAELDQEEAGGAEPSAQLEFAILNGLDISSLPALRDLSTRASTTVHIPWPPALQALRQLEWRVETTTGVQIPRQGEGYGLPECTTARSAGCWTNWSPHGPRDIESRRV